MGLYPGYRHMTGAERRNARMHKIFADAYAHARAEGRSSPWSESTWTRYRIHFTVDGQPYTWERFAPDTDHLIASAHAAMAKEWPTAHAIIQQYEPVER